MNSIEVINNAIAKKKQLHLKSYLNLHTILFDFHSEFFKLLRSIAPYADKHSEQHDKLGEKSTCVDKVINKL